MKESEVRRYLLYLGEGSVLISGTAKTRAASTRRRRFGVAVVLLVVLVVLVAVGNTAFSGARDEVVAGDSSPATGGDFQTSQVTAVPAGVNGQLECAKFCVLFKQFLRAIEQGLLVTSS